MVERANSIFAIQQGIRQIGGNAMSLAALPNRSLHSDATALCHLLHRALWISVLLPNSTPAVSPVSFVVRPDPNQMEFYESKSSSTTQDPLFGLWSGPRLRSCSMSTLPCDSQAGVYACTNRSG